VNTDIAGAAKFGIDSVFVASGLHVQANSGGEAGPETLDERHLAELFADAKRRPLGAMRALAWGDETPQWRQYCSAANASLFCLEQAGIRENHMTKNGNGSSGLGHGYYFEDLTVGMEASVSKKITNEDVLAFADLSGDVNPVHLSDDFAAGTIFKRRIAHGFLTGSLFSTV